VAALVLLVAAQAASAQSSIRSSGDIETEGQLVSTAATGPPIVVASDEVVTDLNADLLDGWDAAALAKQGAFDELTAQLQHLLPRLDLHNSRFRATATFHDGSAWRVADPVAIPAHPDAGFFYFTRDFYADIFLSIVDGRGVNGHWWVFFAPLTNFAYTLRIEDVETGTVAAYVVPAATPDRQSMFDTGAFADSGGYAALAAPPVHEASATRGEASPVVAAALASCSADVDTLCLVDQRFEIEVTVDGGSGPASALVTTDLATSHTGAFGAFAASSIDFVVKIVVTPAAFVVNIGSLSNLDVEATVHDTCTGTSKSYTSSSPSTTNFVDATTFPNVACSP
jgi:hypothetical protein